MHDSANTALGPKDGETDLVAVAHALEHVAAAAGNPVSAEDALRAVSRCQGGKGSPIENASLAAAELGLTARPAKVDATHTGAEIGLHPPGLARLDDGRWVVMRARRGRRFDVAFVSARGMSEETLSLSALERAIGSHTWLHFEPSLALEAVSNHDAPDFSSHPWRRMRAFLGLERPQLIIVGAYALVIGALSLATPIAVQAVVNSVAFGSTMQPLVVLSMLLFGGLAFAGLLTLVEAYVVEVLQRRVFVRVADDFGRRVPVVPAHVHDTRYGPELVNRFFDVVTIQKSLSTLLLDSLSLTLQTAAGMLLLGFYHPLLLAFDVVLLVLLGVVFLMGRGAVPSATEESDAKYRVAAWLEDMARAPGLFRSTSAREHAWNRADLLARDYLGARKAHFRVLLRQLGGGVGLQITAVVALLGVGGMLVMQRQLTIGQLVAAELIVTAMGAAFAKLGKQLEKLYDLNVGVLKVGKVLDLPLERQGGERLRSGGPLPFRAHALDVGRGGRALTREASFEIEAGAHALLDGATGSGKSTLLEVLEGTREMTAGSVQLDGLDLRRADLGSVREKVVLVGEPAFIAGTVLENLYAGGIPMPESETRVLLRLVGLEPTIDELPRGLDAPMTPAGAPMSERQRRRLVLARALARRPRALLLDRALDGLGLPSDALEAVLDYVFAPDAPWTVVVVSDDSAVRARCSTTLTLAQRKVEVSS